MRLPYQRFEDQRSGETLAVLQKVRIDSEKFITSFINVLFTSLVGVVFIMIYAFKVHWSLVFVYFGGCILLGILMNVLSKKIKVVQKNDRERNHYAGGIYYRILAEHRAG